MSDSTPPATMSSSTTTPQPPSLYTIILFYLYTPVAVPSETLGWQERLCKSLNLIGRIRIATEGINGTLAGTKEMIEAYIQEMNNVNNPEHKGIFAGIEYKYSTDSNPPFPALGMFEVPELTATGLMAKSCRLVMENNKPKLMTSTQAKKLLAAKAATDPTAAASSNELAPSVPAPTEPEVDTHLTPEEWHKALQSFNPETDLLLDTRNAYETAIGKFEHAIDPKLRTFAQLPEYITQNLEAIKSKKMIYMYCTGGIRCEKASLYMAHRSGLPVRQLKGGIHKYMDAFPDGGLFKGKNFVFDNRLAMASQDKTIIGKCVQCSGTCDDLSETILCRVCRSFVILCPDCRTMYKEKDWQIYCSEHILLAAGKDYDPTTLSQSHDASSSSTTSSHPTTTSSAPVAPMPSPEAEEAGSSSDHWAPPSEDPGCPEQLNLFLSRFTTAELESQLHEIRNILTYFKQHQKHSGSRSRNRKANLHLQTVRLEDYLYGRRKVEAEARGEVFTEVPPSVKREEEKQAKQPQRQPKGRPDSAASTTSISSSDTSSDSASHPPHPTFLSYVPFLNV